MRLGVLVAGVQDVAGSLPLQTIFGVLPRLAQLLCVSHRRRARKQKNRDPRSEALTFAPGPAGRAGGGRGGRGRGLAAAVLL